MAYSLYDYQSTCLSEAKTAISLCVSEGLPPAVLIQAPTGAGKTVMFVKMCDDMQRAGKSVHILSHRQELVKQISKALTEQGVAHGIISPGQPQTNDLVQVASVFTYKNRIKHGLERPDLIVIDECHHATAGTWDSVLEWHGGKRVGVTATPIRTDGKGLDGHFTIMVKGPSVKYLTTTINPRTGRTFLSPPVVYAPPSVVDLSKVKSAFGDFKKSELEEAVDKATVTGDAVGHYIKLAMGVPAVAFCVTVAHAEHVAEQFRAAGIPAASVDGTMTDERRADVLKSLEDGRIMVLTSCELISEGFDLPKIGCAILLRPTQSLGLYLQQVGRALRSYAGKLFAIILDHVGNCRRHGMPDDDRDWSLEGETKEERKKREKQLDVKTCPECFAAYAPAPVCPVCGHTTKKEEIDVDLETELVAVTADIIKKQKSQERKKEEGKAQSLRQLLVIEKERGYKPGWAEGRLRFRLKAKKWEPAHIERMVAIEKKLARSVIEETEGEQAS